MELLPRQEPAAMADLFLSEETPIAQCERAHLSPPQASSAATSNRCRGSRITRAGNSFLCPSWARRASSVRSRGDVGCCFQQNPPTRHRRPDTVVGLANTRSVNTSIMQTS